MLKWRKKKEKCKGMVYIGFWICEGVVIKVDERGFCAKWRVRCFSWPTIACQGDGEVEIFLDEVLVEECGRNGNVELM